MLLGEALADRIRVISRQELADGLRLSSLTQRGRLGAESRYGKEHDKLGIGISIRASAVALV